MIDLEIHKKQKKNQKKHIFQDKKYLSNRI